MKDYKQNRRAVPLSKALDREQRNQLLNQITEYSALFIGVYALVFFLTH